MLFVLLLIGLAASLQIDHTITTQEGNSGFYTAAVFCFDVGQEEFNWGAGTFEFEATYDTQLYSDVRLHFYSDMDKHWGNVFNDKTGNYLEHTCAEKVQFSNNPSGQPLASGVSHTNQIEQRRRPRFWYFAVVNCDPDGVSGNVAGIRIQGKLLNDINSDKINYEFGVNQQGLQLLYLFFVICYALYVPFNGFVVYQLQATTGVHGFVKIFCFILVVQFLAVMLYCHHFWTFRGDGVGHIGLYYVAQGLELIARTFFVMVLMFMADGWTIRSVGLEPGKKAFILGSLSIVTIVNLCLLLWAYFAITPEMIRPVLVQRVFTYLLLAFWIVFGLWFVKTCMASFNDMGQQSSQTNEENVEAKRNLFLVLAIVFGIWILGLPITTYIALLLDPWVYDIVTHTVNITMTTVGLMAFTAIIWPSRSQKYFQPPTRGGGGTTDPDYNRL